MKLVIAEKPMLARDIARAICGTPVPESAPLPISGNGYTVIACSGHLLELVEPEAVNPAWADRYDLDLLPISIPDWPKEPAVVRDKETGEVIDSKEPLIDKIAVLLPQADCVIHAGDPDDEGQLIVDEVLDYLGYEGEVLRVYVNDNIAKNIVRAFDNLVPNEGCRAAGAAANARSMADKCFGVNESRLASTRLHGGFYVGRVQTPTLGLVVARDEAIENHVTRKFYELTATGGCPDADSQPTFDMLTDYERYQLEWMIEHGHSLKEFVQGLDLVDLDGIDGLEDAYAIWEQDYGASAERYSPMSASSMRRTPRRSPLRSARPSPISRPSPPRSARTAGRSSTIRHRRSSSSPASPPRPDARSR